MTFSVDPSTPYGCCLALNEKTEDGDEDDDDACTEERVQIEREK
jgi:hypothetical protein